MDDVFNNIEPIRLETAVDKIIKQIKQLIISGQLKPGERLPPERVLADRFGVGRGFIREAILKLEFYGLLKTSPQSRTYVSGYSMKIMDNILTDIINFNNEDFASLIESRYIMEIQAARLAAERRTNADVIAMKDAIRDYDSKVTEEYSAVDEDMLFHILIARASKNTILESTLVIIVPDLIKNIHEKKICPERRSLDAVKEHHGILDAIIAQDSKKAEIEMARHLDGIFQVSQRELKNRLYI